SDKIVEMTGATLLDAGCDVNASDNKGRTPLIYAVAFERPAVIELLLKRGANISAKDHNGESALDWAMKSGNQEIIKLLPSLLSSSGVKTMSLKELTEIVDEFSFLSAPEGKKTSR